MTTPHALPRREIDACVHCGFCLPTCPTYALWGEEMDSPRGRIYLLKLASEGAIAYDETLVTHLDRCLGCYACVPACPSGVRFDHLVVAARAQVEQRYRRPALGRLQRALIFRLFPHSGRLRAAMFPARVIAKSGLIDGLAARLPDPLRMLLELAPRDPAPREEVPERLPSAGTRRARVGLLAGCVQDALFSHVNAATARVLAAEGCEVLVPRDAGCCGALAQHTGELDEARRYARHVMDAFDRLGVDAVIVNSAGCGSGMKDYGLLFEGDPRDAERARAFSARVFDIAEYLASLDVRAPRHPLPLRAAYHDPCHLQHAQGLRDAPRTLLRGIPGLELVEIAESAICCGSAGIYNLVEPTAARDLGDRKASNLLATMADVVIASNPGCALQIAAATRRAGREVRVVHAVELLDASIRACPAPTHTGNPSSPGTVDPATPGVRATFITQHTVTK